MIKRCTVCNIGEVKAVGGIDEKLGMEALDICDECGSTEGPYKIEKEDESS